MKPQTHLSPCTLAHIASCIVYCLAQWLIGPDPENEWNHLTLSWFILLGFFPNLGFPLSHFCLHFHQWFWLMKKPWISHPAQEPPPDECWDSRTRHQPWYGQIVDQCTEKAMDVEHHGDEHQTATFKPRDANTFIYTRVCLHLSALYDITSAEGFKIMITTTALIGCHLLGCADCPAWIN